MTCIECGSTFVFSAEDQEFHQKKGYASEPKRCAPCREARRRQIRKGARSAGGGGEGAGAPGSGGGAGSRSGGGSGGGAGGSSERVLFETTCDACGGKAELPFEPRQDRPVYCRACFVKMKDSRR
ncbi:MAG: zinc-ribbon domain containing protein [Planctomycetes bacterium]|nr:zinc-ribbon domain containing protein [Planctomycetota bacterium]